MGQPLGRQLGPTRHRCFAPLISEHLLVVGQRMGHLPTTPCGWPHDPQFPHLGSFLLSHNQKLPFSASSASSMSAAFCFDLVIPNCFISCWVDLPTKPLHSPSTGKITCITWFTPFFGTSCHHFVTFLLFSLKCWLHHLFPRYCELCHDYCLGRDGPQEDVWPQRGYYLGWKLELLVKTYSHLPLAFRFQNGPLSLAGVFCCSSLRNKAYLWFGLVLLASSLCFSNTSASFQSTWS